MQGEFKKIKPPAFDGEQEEVIEACLINMNKCIYIYEYDHKLKAQLEIYQLQGKSTLWWEEVKTIQKIDEHEATLEYFQRHFKDTYLTEQFYDEKEKEFHDPRFEKLIMDEFIMKFTSLLRYISYIHFFCHIELVQI